MNRMALDKWEKEKEELTVKKGERENMTESQWTMKKRRTNSNECNEGIWCKHMSTKTMWIYWWLQTVFVCFSLDEIHSELYRENHTNYLLLPERIIAQRNENANESWANWGNVKESGKTDRENEKRKQREKKKKCQRINFTAKMLQIESERAKSEKSTACTYVHQF